jgi:hypothetical protein
MIGSGFAASFARPGGNESPGARSALIEQRRTKTFADRRLGLATSRARSVRPPTLDPSNIAEMGETYKANEARFRRDYVGRIFSGVVVPENSIRADSRGEVESAHHPMRCLRLSTCLKPS